MVLFYIRQEQFLHFTFSCVIQISWSIPSRFSWIKMKIISLSVNWYYMGVSSAPALSFVFLHCTIYERRKQNSHIQQRTQWTHLQRKNANENVCAHLSASMEHLAITCTVLNLESWNIKNGFFFSKWTGIDVINVDWFEDLNKKKLNYIVLPSSNSDVFPIEIFPWKKWKYSQSIDVSICSASKYKLHKIQNGFFI